MAITDEQFIQAVDAVLDERGPDFRYQRPRDADGFLDVCKYSTDGGETGSCLFGAALIEKLGVKWDEDWEGGSIRSVIRKSGLHLSSRVKYAATQAQELQDRSREYDAVRETWSRGLQGES